jgi:putative molybdenum carrier protein
MRKVVSGGQTGVDRAALDVALELEISCGGWCPKDRMAEDGQIPSHYPLKETASSEFQVRTELNVLDSDGTLILLWGPPSGGTLFTRHCALHHNKPLFETELQQKPPITDFHNWLAAYSIEVLNVAGPRESHCPGQIYEAATAYLRLYLAKARS